MRVYLITKLIVLLFCLTLQAQNAVSVHGALKVSGNKITGSKSGDPAQVAGMSLYWSIWGGYNYYTRETVDWLVKDWNISLIRTAMSVEVNGKNTKGYIGDPSRQTNLVKTVVDAAIANGIYVIVDYHTHDANKNVDHAKKFFSEMAKTYKNTPNIIWEIWNEPDFSGGTGPSGRDSWTDIKNYASQVIPVIREHSSNLIAVGTPTWSQDVDIAAANPIKDPNLAYVLHFYAGTHEEYLRKKAETALNKGVPLIITEFGLSAADGGQKDRNTYTDKGKIWLDWADKHGISWANWSVHNLEESSAALNTSETSGWKENQLSTSGKWMRNRLRSRPKFENKPDPVKHDTLTLPGRIEAEKYFAKSQELKVETTSDDGGGENIGHSVSGSWAEYVVKVPQNNHYRIKARIATETEGGTISIKVNNKKIVSWTEKSTGGWQKWKTSKESEPISFSKGTVQLRVEWSGSAQGILNLNWIEFTRSVPVGIGNIQKKANDLEMITPIVQNGSVCLNVNNSINKVSLFDLRGKRLYSTVVKSNIINIPISRGQHLLKLHDSQGSVRMIYVNGF